MSNTTINNAANMNMASLPSCGCGNGSTNVTIWGNGGATNNQANVNTNHNMAVYQQAWAQFHNSVHSNQNTGGNMSSDNLNGSWWWGGSNGSNSSTTGSSTSNTTINNAANMNTHM